MQLPLQEVSTGVGRERWFDRDPNFAVEDRGLELMSMLKDSDVGGFGGSPFKCDFHAL